MQSSIRRALHLRSFTVAAIGLFVLTSQAWAEPSWTLIDDFNDGVQNSLGGYRSTFASAPSTATAMRVASVHRGEGGRSARVTAERSGDGYCGYWIHFFDMRKVEKEYFDASRFAYLSFWVRGAEGGEDFLIKLADERWIEKEDSVTFAQASHLLPSGVTTEWQEVVVPLRGSRNLDWRRLGGITFEFVHAGKQVVYIDDIALKLDPASVTTAPPVIATTAVPAPDSIPRKLWVWSTQRLLHNEAARVEMFQLCIDQRIDELWMQLLYDVKHADDDKQVVSGCELRYKDETRTLLSQAHQLGIRVHALDGYPDFALRENHAIPLSVVDAVIEFNHASPPMSRFDGIHFDNEPYLLIGWHNPPQREEILRDFLALNAECQRRVSEHSQMEFGIDIPFWWQTRDEKTGKIVAEVEFQGKRQAASYHCLEMLDNVGVMNYRDVADGADGMIAHGRALLDYADKHGRATVYMGVETFRYQPTKVWFASGVSHEQFHRTLETAGEHIARISRLNGLRLRTLDDGERVSLGIELPDPLTADVEVLARKTMQEIARHFGIKATVDASDPTLPKIHEFIDTDAQYSNLTLRPIPTGVSDEYFYGFEVDSVMLSKITFADDSPEDFQIQVRAAEEYFSRYKRYAGTAIHYYETLRDKLKEAN